MNNIIYRSFFYNEIIKNVFIILAFIFFSLASLFLCQIKRPETV